MKTLFVILFVFPPLAVFAARTPLGTAISLDEAYHSALNRTETAGIAQARINQSDARVSQAWSKFFPQLSFGANYLRQDAKGTSGTASAIFPGATSYTRLTLSQSIFEGFRDKANIDATHANREAQEQNLLVAKYNVFSSVARTYYAVLSGQREVSNIQKTTDLASSRLKEIRSRTDIGRSRKVELLAAQAQLAVLDSQLMAAEGTLVTVREQFALLTGLDNNSELIEPPQSVNAPKDLPAYLVFLDKRPDVASLKSSIDESHNNIRVARAGHFPSVNALGNYYFTRQGPQKGNNWDVGVTLTFPLFSGGMVSAQVREYSEKEKENTLLLSQTRRNAEIAIRTAYNTLISSLKQIKSLESALDSTEQNYKEQEKNYRFGQATNLDVIQALNVYLDTKRTLDRTRYQGMTAWADLNSATAQVP